MFEIKKCKGAIKMDDNTEIDLSDFFKEKTPEEIDEEKKIIFRRISSKRIFTNERRVRRNFS